MPYDFIKSHKKPGFHPLFRRSFEKPEKPQEIKIYSPTVLGLKVVQNTFQNN